MLEDNMRSPTESTGDSYNDKVVMTKQGCHDKARLSWLHQLKVLTDDHVCELLALTEAPVRGSEREVPLLRNSELAREHCFYVPDLTRVIILYLI